MFALLFACERATDNVALEADKAASRHAEELEPADKDDGGEEMISGIQMSPMTEACASALQMNFEQFYAAWDPKWGTPEVDVADLIMQVQKLKSKQASEAPKVEAVDAPARRAPRESSEDEFLTEFMRTPPASPATAAAISAAVAEVEEARLAKVAEEPDLAKVAEAFKLEDADLEKVWVVVLEKPSGTACEAGVRVRVPDGRSHALQVLEILEGPVKAWNKANPEKAINVGDEIVEVNGQMGSGTLLRERLREDAERRVLVQRRRSAPARPIPATPAKKPARSWSFRLPKWRFRRSA